MEKIIFKNFPYKTTPLNDANLNQLQTNVENALNNKVDKVEGKGLSTNDYTTTEKNKLGGIEAGANKTTIADDLTTNDSTKVLSAKQGKILNEEKFDKIGGTITGDVNITGSLTVDGIPLIDLTYPVGSIYISVNNINPSALFGGTWERFGQGRVLVGVDTSQSEFNTVMKTGGSKTHNHTSASHSHGSGNLVSCYYPKNSYGNACFQLRDIDGGFSLSGYMGESRTWNNGGGAAETGIAVRGTTSSATPGATGSSSTLQPYITVYMWKRTE